jgi:LysR family hydrogen peroxide-inducible transcriptional activator
MQKIRKALPDLKLMLYEYQTENLLKRLRDGELDLGVIALPAEDEGLESRELYHEDFLVALPSLHPLGQKSSIKVQDLKDQTLLLLEDGHCLRDQALEVCSRVEVREHEDFRATSLETLRQMVVAGLGITLMPEFALDPPFGSQRGLTVRPFGRPTPKRIVGAVWRKTSTRSLAIEAVCDVVHDVMSAKV